MAWRQINYIAGDYFRLEDTAGECLSYDQVFYLINSIGPQTAIVFVPELGTVCMVQATVSELKQWSSRV